MAALAGVNSAASCIALKVELEVVDSMCKQTCHGFDSRALMMIRQQSRAEQCKAKWLRCVGR